MTLDEIKRELDHMPEEQQAHLMAYLVHLRHLRDPDARRELEQRLDNKDPSHWISVDELKERWKEQP